MPHEDQPRNEAKGTHLPSSVGSLALTTCYPAFLITAEVLVIYMHQLWATISKHSFSYRFKIDNKRFSVNVEVFREILNICPKVPGKAFDEPPTKEEALSFICELGHTVEIKYITDVIVDHLQQPWRNFASFINKCLCEKIHEDIHSSFPYKDKSVSMRNNMFMHTARDDSILGTMGFVSRHEDTQVYDTILPKDMKNQAMLDSVAYKTYYAFASGAKLPKSKKKKSDSTISSDESPSKKKSAKAKKYAGTKPKPTKKIALVKADQESLGNSDEEDDDEEDDFENAEKEEYDDERVHTPLYYELTKEEKIDDEEKLDEEEDKVTKELYKDVNVNLGNKDAKMTDADQGGADQQNVSQESVYEQVEKDARVTLTAVHDTQKTDGTTQSSSVLSDFTNRYVDNKLGEAVYKAIQSYNAECREEAQSKKLEYIDLVDTSVKSIIIKEVKTQLPRILHQAVSDLATHVIEKKVIESLEVAVFARSSSQPTSTYKATASLSEFELTKILMDKMEENKSHLVADYKKELYDALVNYYNTNKDLFNTYDQRTKRRKSSKEAESSKDPKSMEGKSSSLSKITSRSHHKSSGKSAHAEEPSHIVDDWKVRQNQEFDTRNDVEQPDDEEAPRRDCDTAHAEEPPTSFDELNDTSFDFSAFVMNRLKIPNLTQEILVGPAFNLLKGTYKSTTELEYHFEECSKATTGRLDWHNPKGKSLTVMKWYDYSHLDEIEVRREDLLLYTFKEGDFPHLCLQDIDDMLLLLVQQKLTNLTIDEHYDLNVELRMFTRRIVIQRRVEDLQLDPQGVIHVDQLNRNRLMRTDELHKFSDGTLDFFRTTLHDIASGIRMEYLPKKHWSNYEKEHAKYNESNTYVIERFNTAVGNPVNETLLKLSLPDHGSILTDSKRRSVKVKELQERCNIKAFKLKDQEKYEHVGPKVTNAQDGKRSQVDDKGDCIWLMISQCSRS
nr:hypothetical protein [Tanacetum cinerariifolium]